MKWNLWSTRAVTLFVLGTVAGSAFAGPQRANSKLTLPGGGNWTATKVSPSVVAARTDRQFAGLTGVLGQFQMRMKWSMGTVGQFVGHITIKSPNTYRIEYVGTSTDEANPAGTAMMVADGKRFTDHRLTGWTKPVPFARRKIMPKKLLPNMAVYVDQWIFAAIGGGAKPLGTLVKEINQPGSGFVVKTEEQWGEIHGQKLVSYRLRIERTPANTKSIGPFFAEFVIDGTHWLPKLIRIWDKGKGKTRSAAEIRYFWKLKNNKPFDSSLFKIGK